MRGTIRTIWLVAVLLTVLGTNGAEAQSPAHAAPDFSLLKPWYDVVSWTYTESPGRLALVVKPKTAPPQTHRGFAVRYLDESGADVVDANLTQLIPFGYNTPAGESEAVGCSAPSGAQWSRVKRVTVFQIGEDGKLTGPTPEPQAAPRAKPAPQTPAAAPTAACSYEVPAAVSSATPFSQPLVKRLLYERYAFEANTGGLSSPSRIGVTYLALQLLTSYTNTVTVVPGRGAERRQDGAPENTTIYPFQAKYIVCRGFANATTRTQYECRFVCFKDRRNQWSCAPDGVPKTTTLP